MEIFEARAAKYGQHSWVTDREFGRRIVELAQAGPSTVMLDMATGTGAVARLFCGQVGKIFAVDNSLRMLTEARETLKDEPTVALLHRDGQDTGLPGESFDLIICRNSLHHFDNPQLGLREVGRILKPDGVFLLIEPVAPNDESKEAWSELFRIRDKGRHPDFYFTASELAAYVAGEGFEVERSEEQTLPVSMSGWLDTGSLSDDECTRILKFVNELPTEMKSYLGLECTEGAWSIRHVWVLLRLRKATSKGLEFTG